MNTHPENSDPDAVAQREKDAKDYVREWRIWAGVAVVVALVWALMSWRVGHLITAWPPLVVMGVWAAVLIALPIFPRSGSSS